MGKGITYFLVNFKETDVGLFHGKEEHERAATVADAGCAATAVHKGAVDTGRERDHHMRVAGCRHRAATPHGSAPPCPSLIPEIPELAVKQTANQTGFCQTLNVN